MHLFDRWRPDRDQMQALRRLRHGPSCSRCGGTECSGRCRPCGKYFCVTCIDAHLDDDDPESCEMMRILDPNRPVDLQVKGKIDWTTRQ
jgi:hypothetical protein